MSTLGPVTLLGRHGGGVTCVRISPSSGRIYSSSLDRTVRIWGNGRSLIRFPKVHLYPQSASVPAWANTLAINDKYLVCGMHNGAVRLYSPANGHLIRELPNPQERSAYPYNFHTVTTHPADPEVVVGSNGGYLVIWSAGNGEITWRQTSFRLINTVRFLRGGTFLMAHEWDPWLHVWHFPSHERVQLETSVMDTSANWVTACAAPAGSGFDFVLATEDADESRLVAVNLDNPEPVWQAVTEGRVHDLCFLPDGRHLLAGGDSGILELWNTASNRAQRLDLRSDAALEAEFSDKADRTRGLILTTPSLNVDHDPPWTIHSLDVASDGTFAVLGMANGMVLRVATAVS